MIEGTEIEEKAENITGWFFENYTVIAPADDSIKRHYAVYSLYYMANPIETNFAYIPPPNTKRVYAEIVMNNTLNVLKKCSGRSKHFPRLKHHGLIKKVSCFWS
uniref:Uncharacterized protein n=1 Tax=Panagrolaimus davidi TaxID=227884 RepID=A0A914P887_9BILA